MIRRVISVIFSAVLLMGLSVGFSADRVSCSADAYALYCVNNGELLLSRDETAPLSMASTTKVMSAWLTLEQAQRDDRVVTFTDEMIAEGSSMYLQVGEQLHLSDLAVGMLLCSGNDAANAAAIAIGGSIEGFAKRMNARAAAIGMTQTHFVTPSGLDDDDHYSTAYDMALLLAAAMENDSFREICGSSTMQVSFVYPPDKRVSYQNHNRLLSLYPDCIGGKTGYTEKSGRCLVSCAERDGVRLVCVTLGDPDDWDDHMALFDEGFEQLRAVSLGESRYTVAVAGGDHDTLTLTADLRYLPVVPAGSPDPTVAVYLPAFAYAPISRGDVLGEVRCTVQDHVIASYPLTASSSVDRIDVKITLLDRLKELLPWHS